jgi:dTDP-4-dehydrorhamnose reductase
MTTIVLLGADGQVGYELQKTLFPLGTVKPFTRSTLDLTNPDEIAAVLEPIAPDFVVNAAAYTAVDKAESEPELAHLINGAAPTALARVAQTVNAQLVHISTDYVFDGQQGWPYEPTDKPNPMGVYGHSKLAGESGIQSNCDRYWILRTAWVYGTHGKGNFVKTMLRLGAERDAVRVVVDQVGTPTWARSIAEAIATLIGQPVQVPSGIYHFTNSGITSWYDFAEAIFAEARLLGVPLKLEKVIPITTPEYPTPAKRPHYSALSWQTLLPFLPAPPIHWRAALRQMLQEWIQEQSKLHN